jgi:hypothetical protein
MTNQLLPSSLTEFLGSDANTKWKNVADFLQNHLPCENMTKGTIPCNRPVALRKAAIQFAGDV